MNSAHLTITTSFLLGFLYSQSCCAQSSIDSLGKPIDLRPQVVTESLHFTANQVETYNDSSRAEFDTITGYRKYYYPNGKLKMEGRVTKGSLRDYRDGVWNYYNEQGQLVKQETSSSKGKLNELELNYSINGNLFTERYQYFKGDYKDKATFQFIKIEIDFYTNGQKLEEEHFINNKNVFWTCWDPKGNEKPIEYLKTIKSKIPRYSIKATPDRKGDIPVKSGIRTIM
jgi:hypothetical protein